MTDFTQAFQSDHDKEPHALSLIFAATISLLLLLASFVAANTEVRKVSGTRITQAELTSQSGRRNVALPHILNVKDFGPEGGRIRYRFDVNLAALPERPLGVYVPKLSLSGRLYLNDTLIGTCGHAALEDLRCLYQSSIFVAPPSAWRQGTNRVELEIYATPRQTNGLSAIVVGDAETLHNQTALYRWLHKDLLIGLTWISATFGFLALGVGIFLKTRTVYFWFGLTSIVNAAASLNDIVTDPVVPIDIFNWIVFWTRLVSVPLLYLTILALFDKSNPLITRLCVAFLFLAPVAIWVSDNNRVVAAALYLPWLIFAPVVAVSTLRWSIRSGNDAQRLVTALLWGLTVGGTVDWLRTVGVSKFEVNHLLSYLYGGTLAILGVAFLRSLAKALDASELRAMVLEKQAAEQFALEVTKSSARFRNFFYLPLVGAAITSQDKGWIDVNQQTCNILGYQREELFGKTWAEITHPEDIAADEAQFQRMVDGQINGYSLEKRFIRPDGSVVWTIVSGGRSITEDKESGHFYVQLLDITERKRFEAELVEARDVAEQARNLLLKANEELQRYADLQVRETQLRERERIIRDMHDGFGSQLASLRIMAEQGQLEERKLPDYLRELSADLVLIFDTLGQANDASLGDALADMRYRLQQRLNTGRPKLHWQVDVPAKGVVDSHTNLHILRIVQEAVNNALRHADPENIWIKVAYDHEQRRLELSVRDDGSGFQEPVVRGRGLGNIEKRVSDLNGELSWVLHQPGTELLVTATV